MSLLGLVVPGLGHLVLGRNGKAVAFLLLLGGLFFVGISLDPDYYQKFGAGILGPPRIAGLEAVEGAADGNEGLVDIVSRVLFTYVFPFCVGFVHYLVGWWVQPFMWGAYQGLGLVGNPGEAPVSIKDVGYCFAQLAGLLNLLAMMDAYDISANRELYKKRGFEAP